jgi:glutathione S-transferase
MITLYQFPTYWGLANVSPFCFKLETYLSLSGLPYEVKITTNTGRAPKGKLPFIQDGDTTISDTSVIIDYLKKKYGDTLDQHLTAEQKAQGIVLQRMLEEHLYFVCVYSRWLDPETNQEFLKTIFAKVPPIIKWLIVPLLQKQVKKQLWQQGIGRHSSEEIYRLGLEDVNAAATILGSRNFLFGEKPTTYDVILYTFLASILIPPVNSPVKTAISQKPELVAFCTRMHKLAFPNGAAEDKESNYQGA